MPIDLTRNGNYGGTAVNQKYTPLDGVIYSPNDEATYSGLLTNRERQLNNRGLWPANLWLVVQDWTTIVAAESPAPAPAAAAVARLPPIVVVSSNRSSWIAEGLQVAATEFAQYNPAIDNVADLRALQGLGGSTQSPPIYTPARVGGNRSIYIVVHASEYSQYRKALANSGITVVGWDFRQGSKMGDRPLLTGFGATRFAAIEFCKQLRRRAHARAAGFLPAALPVPWNYAWLFDDNVVALSNVPTLATVEAALAAPAAPHVAIGFKGGSSAEDALAFRDWARREVGAGRNGPAANLPAAAAKGLIQQASLWNIGYLDANAINFGRVFITSGEDVGLAAYLDYSQRPYAWYEGIVVKKETIPQEDGTTASKSLKRVRAQLAKVFVDSEAASPPVATPPVPLLVKPSNNADGGPQILRDFVVDHVLPNSQLSAQAGDAGTRNNACSQAAEQLVCGAIKEGATCIQAAALTASLASFPANYAVQEVNRP